MERTSEEFAAAVQRLVDRAEIEDCMLRYCRGVDRYDLDLVRSSFHSDAYDDHGRFKGPASELIGYLGELLPRFDALTHFRGNMLIEFQDDDCAHVETYALAYHRLIGRPEQELLCVRYLDRFERRSGEWRIAHRRVVVDWSAGGDAAPSVERAAQFIQGRHSMSDPVYHSPRDAAPNGTAG